MGFENLGDGHHAPRNPYHMHQLVLRARRERCLNAMSLNSTFPPPLPDELLWSTIARWSRLMMRPGNTAFSRFLLRDSEWGYRIAIDFPAHLDEIARYTPSELGLSADKLRDQHTMYPFVAPFAPAETVKAMAAAMATGGKTGTYSKAWSAACGIQTKTCLRYCPDCFSADRDRYGFAYWHRMHQLEGLDGCHIHGCELLRSDVSRDTARYVALDELRKPDSTMRRRSRVFPKVFDDVLRILETRPVGLQPGLGTALRHAFETHTQKICTIERLLELGPFLAAEARVPFAYSSTTRCRILRGALFPELARPALVCAVDYSILCRLLNLQVAAAPASRRLRESGPWQCKAPGGECYGQLVIQDYYSHNGRASFRCPNCGGRYIRPFPLVRGADETFAFKLVEPSLAWAKALPDFWRNPDSTWGSLRKHFGRSLRELRSAVGRMGLGPMPGRELPRRRVASDLVPKRELKRAQRRAEFVEILRRKPSGSGKRLTVKENSVRGWLRLNDGEWFKSVAENYRSVPRAPKRSESDIEREALDALTNVANECRKARIGSQGRFKKAAIKTILYPKLSGHARRFLDAQPSLMDPLVETRAEFVDRRMRECAPELKAEDLRDFWEFTHRVGIETTLVYDKSERQRARDFFDSLRHQRSGGDVITPRDASEHPS